MLPTSSEMKRTARSALKDHWLTALQIALIVNLPSLLVTGIASFTGCSQTALLNTAIQAATSEGVVDARILLEQLSALVHRTDLWILQGGWLVAWLLTPILSLGLNVWMLNRLRGETLEIGTVFCRLKIAPKAVGLRLLIVLKVFLWMLPGVGLTCLAMLPVIQSTATTWDELLPALNTTMRLTSLASLVMSVPAVMAYLRYFLADIQLAEKPETGIRESVARSKNLMTARKGSLFFLLLSFLLWYFAEILVSDLIASMFGNVASLATQLLISLALTVYVQMTVCVFYRTVSQTEESAGNDATQVYGQDEDHSPDLN